MTNHDHDVSQLMVNIQEGMNVLDSNEENIGSVKFVKMGDENPNTPQVEASTAGSIDSTDMGIDDVLADLFEVNTIPEVLQEKMLRHGYIGIDGLLSATRFALSEQISHIHDDHIHLNVNKDELITK